MEVCRCGWNGKGDHPCHYDYYTCRKPAKERVCATGLAILAGVTPKLSAYITYACDAHWELFQEKLKEERI